MKKILLFALPLLSLVFASCMDDGYDTPQTSDRGNKKIEETNVVSIRQLKETYRKYIETDYRDGESYTRITDDVKIKAIVTGNDVQGNLYNEIAVQDSTGAIIIAINEGGIFGYLPVGTEILVDLNGLYIGNYGKQAEIGTPYTTTSNGSTYTRVSRMSRLLWNQHYRILGRKTAPEPIEFDYAKWNEDPTAYGGMLTTIKRVKLSDVDSTTTWANPEAGAGSKAIYLTGSDKVNKTCEVYTSNYADFAAVKVPQGYVDITGIMKRYNNYWEIIIRSIDDVKEVK